MLGSADHVLVTKESTNMITDAAFTGKPVHLLELTGQHKKFDRFHHDLKQKGIIRPLKLPLETWAYEPLRETDRVAADLLSMWENR